MSTSHFWAEYQRRDVSCPLGWLWPSDNDDDDGGDDNDDGDDYDGSENYYDDS